MPILGDKNSDVYLGEMGSKGEKAHKFHFHLKIDLHPYVHATCALIEDFEIFR